MKSIKSTRGRHTLVIVAIVAAILLCGKNPVFAGNNTADNIKPQYSFNSPAVDASYNGKNATRIPVITYHSIVSDKEKRKYYRRNSLVISKSTFTKQMKYLHDKGWRTLSMEEFYLWHQGKIKVPRKSVVITFDDADAGAVKYAPPVLKKYKMKGTTFVVADWTNKATAASKKGKSNGFATWQQLQKVNKSYPNFEIASHTYNMHNRWKGMKPATAFSLDKQNKDFAKMYSTIGSEYLAYPWGTFTDKTIKAARANHIKMAFTYGRNAYATRKQNIYKIRRIKISGNGSMNQFKKWFK